MVEIHSSCFLSSFLSSPAFPLPIASQKMVGLEEEKWDFSFFLLSGKGESVCVCVCVCVVDDVILGSKGTGRTR